MVAMVVFSHASVAAGSDIVSSPDGGWENCNTVGTDSGKDIAEVFKIIYRIGEPSRACNWSRDKSVYEYYQKVCMEEVLKCRQAV